MGLLEIYYYLFYKFYRLFEAFEQTRWLTTTKAAICIGSLELGIYFSFINYRDVLLRQNSNFEYYSFIVILIIILSKWFAFFQDNRWKDYVKSFDNWPKAKNRKGSWIVFIIVILVVSNFIISCILFSPLRVPDR